MNTPASRLLNAASAISIESPGTARMASSAPRTSTRGGARSAAAGSGSGSSMRIARRWTSEPDGEDERAVERPAHAELADHQAAEHRRDGEREPVTVPTRPLALSAVALGHEQRHAGRQRDAPHLPGDRAEQRAGRRGPRTTGCAARAARRCRRPRRRRSPPRSTTRRWSWPAPSPLLAVVVDVGAERRADGGGREAEGRRRSRRWRPPTGSRGTPRRSGRTRGTSSSPRSPACWRAGGGRRPARRAAGGDQSRARRSCR